MQPIKLTAKEEKNHDHIRYKKIIWRNPTPIYDQRAQCTRNKGKLPQLNKDHLFVLWCDFQVVWFLKSELNNHPTLKVTL